MDHAVTADDDQALDAVGDDAAGQVEGLVGVAPGEREDPESRVTQPGQRDGHGANPPFPDVGRQGARDRPGHLSEDIRGMPGYVRRRHDADEGFPMHDTSAPQTMTLPDGRTFEYLVEGDPDGYPLVHHHGTPGASVPFPKYADAAKQRGLALIQYSRAGYGGSEPRPGRTVADVPRT